MSTDNNTSASTLKSYVDGAIGTTQSAIGSVTGSSQYKDQGEATRQQAETEHIASHTTAKLGPYTADPNTGAIAKDNEDRSAGSWDQTIGAAKESVGNLFGYGDLRQQGVRQNVEGQSRETRGQLEDLGGGITNRTQGALGSVGSAITGDRESENKWRDVHDEGKVKQRGVEADLRKGIGN